MYNLSELYQEVILDHNKSPRNFQKLEGANHQAEGYNPLCGDQITIYVLLEDGIIKNVAFQGSGCAISRASASMMTGSIKGKTIDEAEKLVESMHDMFTGAVEAEPESLGKLAALSGVCQFPTRVKCATLPWHTLRAAIKSQSEKVTTE